MDIIREVRALALLAALLAAAAGAARGQQPVTPPPPGARATAEGVVIDFQDADVRTVITALAEAAGLNVIYGDLPQRRITLRLRQPVPADSVRGLLRTIAESNGLRVVDHGGLLRFDAPVAAAPAPAAQTAGSAAGGDVALHVYRLKHVKAERLAATLQSIFGGGGASAAGSSRAPLSERLRGQQIPPMFLDTLGRRLVTPAPAAGAGASQGVVIPAQMQGEVQIVPDETTNSLLVRAAASDWTVIQQAIAAMDLRPLQVLIEVVVAEVRRTDEIEVGVGGSGTRTGGRADASGQLGRDSAAAGAGELILRWMNGGKVDVDVALRALATRGNVRILSRPVLLAQNNQEAHILVGSQQPFVQASISGAADILTRDIVQYQKVGTQLTILPTVNPDGYVNLEVIQEVSAATNETRFNAPVISTREASTFLFVRDGQTTVIGGLIDRQASKSRSGIPVLINIPLLGALFGTTRNGTTVSEMFLFLTPHIVSSDEDVDRLRNSIEQHLDLLETDVPKMRLIGPGPAGGPPAPERKP